MRRVYVAPFPSQAKLRRHIAGHSAASERVKHQIAGGVYSPIDQTGDGPLVVREKTHPADPMTLDQALYEMELVGHDFYLFVDKESERPSVVYRRRGYDYGVISLDLGES